MISFQMRRFCVLALSPGLPLALATPLSIGLEIGLSTTLTSCDGALNTLATHSIFSIPSDLCVSYLRLSPATETITSTHIEPLTEVYGVVSTAYASPAPPGTTTIAAPPISTNATTTLTLTSTSYDYSYRYFTLTDTTTVSKLCKTSAPELELAVKTACQCAGFDLPTTTITSHLTTTGGFAILTRTILETVSVRWYRQTLSLR